MVINGTNIFQSYGLRLSWIDGHLNLPDRKKILSEPGTEQKDIVFDERRVTVTLIGIYQNKATMRAVVAGLTAIMLSKAVHTVTIPNHLFSESVVFDDGAKVEVSGNAMEVKISMVVTNG